MPTPPPGFAPLPDPPYYAVIFASLPGASDEGYGAMAEQMAALAAQQPGYIGMESARDGTGFGLTVSYWADEAALIAWKAVAKHQLAQQLGKDRWYRHYALRVAKVERQYDGPEGR
ncbi:heme-degrading monooxygenase HmoA [Thioclava sp. ES.031]|uniref:antibiotic biosynthesis monooxygenase family protein n=1 Tax=Thioclava sp. ES.031 TaxID=1798203 RepID=UPI000BF30D84|nr:antibiotic biosynthesis monooxygenase [Thioclava sp. ES.031]PFG64127.1 heme-degrading monooxygenase HmoA [Thioclava sp. ES.031]